MSRTAFIDLGAMAGPMMSSVARKRLAISAYDIVRAVRACGRRGLGAGVERSRLTHG
ncbi:3-hydroxyisobutyrate dehydrogenase-like beta-hydroxyacid dehydrogenase [Rhizobium petrolearium]|uniref:Uncharacterized protein n=2 Tax=Neorhizobium TaxID=1525371 RepID=A0ABV0MA14_9HYPH|nr:hypothetical protein [Neorhizobium petrolearium]MBP1847254.1 3-hydroxyisobutyrate dehydrogenase-like beta-hydroxyacid dehydrogenase [Neorhizobium petrolearium]MCC2614298.1 hypothetical protein [Neorhizobium petrolearium]WGI72401.1 hypothetical protein QEO92_31325 [Neorhizobium petrolearium]